MVVDGSLQPLSNRLAAHQQISENIYRVWLDLLTDMKPDAGITRPLACSRPQLVVEGPREARFGVGDRRWIDSAASKDCSPVRTERSQPIGDEPQQGHRKVARAVDRGRVVAQGQKIVTCGKSLAISRAYLPVAPSKTRLTMTHVNRQQPRRSCSEAAVKINSSALLSDLLESELFEATDEEVAIDIASAFETRAMGEPVRPVRRPPPESPLRVEPTANALAAYMRSIGSIPVLKTDAIVELAKIMETQRASFRQLLYAIPGTARYVLNRWEARRRAGLVTAALAAGSRDGGDKDWEAHIDRAMAKLEPAVVEREALWREPGSSERRREILDGEIQTCLTDTGLAWGLITEIHKEFSALVQKPPTVRSGEARRTLGTGVPAARDILSRSTRALEILDEAKKTFITHNLKLVVKVAKDFRNMGVPYLDLIQEGNLGLIRAVEKFEWRHGFKFSTYAVYWIRQSLIRAVQNHSRTVRAPVHMYDHQLRYRHAMKDLNHRLRRAPTRMELAEALEVNLETLERIEATMTPIASISSPVVGTDDLPLEDRLTDNDAPDPVDGIERRELNSELQRLMEGLDPRERRILKWRYCLKGSEAKSLAEIGRRIGRSGERVRQLETRALRKLREYAGGRGLEESLSM